MGVAAQMDYFRVVTRAKVPGSVAKVVVASLLQRVPTISHYKCSASGPSFRPTALDLG
jgi:hypothetical protein